MKKTVEIDGKDYKIKTHHNGKTEFLRSIPVGGVVMVDLRDVQCYRTRANQMKGHYKYTMGQLENGKGYIKRLM